MPKKSIPFVILLGTLYGTTLIASRFSVSQFAPTVYVGLRLVIASLLASSIYLFSIQGRKLPKDKELWKKSAFLGVLGSAVPMILIIYGIQYLSSGLTSILITISPVFTVVLAHFNLRDEKLSTRKSLGIVLAISGALLLILLGESGLPNVDKADPRGYLYLIAAMFVGSSMIIYTRKQMSRFDSFEVSSIRLFSAAVFVMTLSLLTTNFDLSQVNGRGYFALFYASFSGTFLGIILEFYIIKHFGATTSVMSSYIIPIVASIGGAFLLNEKITTGMAIGMFMIIGGIGIINQRVVKYKNQNVI